MVKNHKTGLSKKKAREIMDQNSVDDWVQWENKLYFFKRFIYENPGMSRFDLARQYKPAEDREHCQLDNDFEFRKAISYLKFNGEIFEDEEGFFYGKNKGSLSF